MIYRFGWKATHTLLWTESKAVRIRFTDRTSCTDGFAVSDHCSFVLLLKRLNEKLMYNHLVKNLKLYKYIENFWKTQQCSFDFCLKVNRIFCKLPNLVYQSATCRNFSTETKTYFSWSLVWLDNTQT